MHEPHSNNENIAIERWSIYVAAFAGLWSLLCFAMINYNVYVVEVRIRHNPAMIMDYPQIIAECVWFAPFFALLIFRHVIALVLPYAVLLLIILSKFIGRDIVLQKFDWADLLFYLLGVFSLVVILIWIAVRSAFVVRQLVKR
jgi:hypothetical protein